MHLMRAMGTTWSWLDVSIGQNTDAGFIQCHYLVQQQYKTHRARLEDSGIS
jgi:hypothetical protein